MPPEIRAGSTETEDSPDTNEPLRPETRHVSLIAYLAEAVLGRDFVGRGLEVGSGYGCLLFPMASLFPKIQWFAVEHPDQPHASRKSYLSMFRSYNCHLENADLLCEPFPFPDNHFALVTFPRFSNICLPTASILCSLKSPELYGQVAFLLPRLLMKLRWKIGCGCSRERASWTCLTRLGKVSSAISGYIRPRRFSPAMAKRGFTLERCEMESGYRGNSDRSWIRRLHRAYEYLESKLGIMGSLSDTWHMAFPKTVTHS